MDNLQETIIRLQDLNFISGTDNTGANETFEQEKQAIKRKFSFAKEEVTSFFAKNFPQVIDVVCTLNKSIGRRGNRLYFNNQEVKSSPLQYDKCLTACKEALSSFPNSLNAMVSALKGRASQERIDEVSLNLCREFNTLSAFRDSSDILMNENISHIIVKPVQTEREDYSENFSEAITVPVGKNGKEDVSVEFNVLRPDAHAVIAGMSGSGKSSLLQSLILGGAYKYSPDKLRFWILDFKDGTGLIQFKALKHVRVMSVKNRAIDANEIMDYIKGEYNKRAEKIAESGGGDIRDYNRRAKAENKSLMPRLLIIIDEFAIMHRSCFSLLNEIAKVGRSMGIGFVLSSQIIETGAAYGDAVQQANHLFEFKNADSAFGRLVKNVTEEEKKFVCSGVTGNCIYRRDTKRTLFRVAYAGGINEQNSLINKINDKWSEFPYREPIITGRPERKIQNPSALVTDGCKTVEAYKRTKKVFIPIGESRLGEPYMYKIDRENHLLVAFGDEARVASVELSVIEHFKPLSGSDKAVYYIDLNCNPDREINAVTSKYGEASEDDFYVATDNGAKKVIDKVYKTMLSRRQLARTDRTKDIGNPIELIIHNAERLSELKDEKRNLRMGPITRNSFSRSNSSAVTDLDEMLSGSLQPETPEEKADVGTLQKLREIIENGKNSRINIFLYFEEKSRFQNLSNELFPYNYDFKDVLVVPRIPDDYEEISYSEVIDCLTACRLRDQAAVFEQAKLVKSDFICAVLVDDKVPHKIIPYEWEE